jgi:ADP-ribose pyrophosphatase
MVWKKLESHLKADFPLFKVFEDVVKLPNGLELDYYWVDKIPVAVILPIISDKIILIKQYRYPIKSFSLELPAGHIGINEIPKDCAERELKEETGFTAGKIEKMLEYHPSTEYSTQIYHIFVAENLKEGKTNRERYEIIDLKLLKPKSVIEKIIKGEITDGRTITSILLAEQMSKI